MTKTPEMKREVAVSFHNQPIRSIIFYATQDAADEFAKFGTYTGPTGIKDEFCLTVDPRYDFDEVLAYIEGYNK